MIANDVLRSVRYMLDRDWSVELVGRMVDADLRG